MAATAARRAELDWQEEDAWLLVSTDPFPTLLFHKTYPGAPDLSTPPLHPGGWSPILL